MAAVIHPELQPEARPAGRPDLRVVPPVPRRRVRVSDRQRAVYHRRRLAVLVVAVMLTALVWSLLTLGGGGAASVASEPPVPVGEPVIAQPGDTYWSLAQRLGGDGDIRERVDALVHANEGAALDVGDRIVVPRSLGAVPAR